MKSFLDAAPYETLHEPDAALDWKVASAAMAFRSVDGVWCSPGGAAGIWAPDSGPLDARVLVPLEVVDRVAQLADRLHGRAVLCITWSSAGAGMRGIGEPVRPKVGRACEVALTLPAGMLRGTVSLGVEVLFEAVARARSRVKKGSRIALLGRRQTVAVDGSGGLFPVDHEHLEGGLLWRADFQNLDAPAEVSSSNLALVINTLHKDAGLLMSGPGELTPVSFEAITAWCTLLLLEYAKQNSAVEHKEAVTAYQSDGVPNIAAFVERVSAGLDLDIWAGGDLHAVELFSSVGRMVLKARFRRRNAV
jgi:hypothetical protein